MSNSSLQPDQDALRESAIAVITYVGDAMNEGVALLREHKRLLTENQNENTLAKMDTLCISSEDNLRHVNDYLQKVKSLENSVITIDQQLQDTGKKLSSFQDCLKNLKAIVEPDIRQLEILANQLQIELSEAIQTERIISRINLKLCTQGIENIEKLTSGWTRSVDLYIRAIIQEEIYGIAPQEMTTDIIAPYEEAYFYFPLRDKIRSMDSIKSIIGRDIKDLQDVLNYECYKLLTVKDTMLKNICVSEGYFNTNEGLLALYNMLCELIKYHCDTLKYGLLDQVNKTTKKLYKLVKENTEKTNKGLFRYEKKDYPRPNKCQLLLVNAQERLQMSSYYYSISYQQVSPKLSGSIEEIGFKNLNDLTSWYEKTISDFKGIGEHEISAIVEFLNKLIHVYIRWEKPILDQYIKSLECTIQANKNIQNSCAISLSKCKQLLEQTVNLESDLKYHQKYSKQN